MIDFADRPDDLLNRYLDGTATPDERRVLEARLAADAALRAEVDAQRALDAALRRRFTPPDTAVLARTLHAPTPPRRLPFPRRPLALAAALAMLLTGGWLLVRTVRGPAPAAPTPALAYYDAAAADFTPQIVCRDAREFTEWFRYQFGVPLTLDTAPPDGIDVLGLRYGHTLTPETIHLLARVDEYPVVVFIDRGDVPWSAVPAARDGLFIHRGRAGALGLIEVSPLDRPRILPLLTVPEARP